MWVGGFLPRIREFWRGDIDDAIPLMARALRASTGRVVDVPVDVPVDAVIRCQMGASLPPPPQTADSSAIQMSQASLATTSPG